MINLTNFQYIVNYSLCSLFICEIYKLKKAVIEDDIKLSVLFIFKFI
jgi:hypothetical protein